MTVQELIEQLSQVADKSRKVVCYEGTSRKQDLRYGEVFEIATSDAASHIRLYSNP